MTDRELLEMAAKAAGLNMVDYHAGTARIELPERDQGDGWVSGGNVPWNPLHDDGDALRLAVKLGIDVFPWQDKHHDRADLYAATRRAIVRAAAAIAQEALK